MNQTTMIEVLQASAPFDGMAEKLQLFGQFVGSWDARVVNYKPDGSHIQTVEAEWHFGWVLEGRAIQDVWIAPKRSLRAAGGNAPGDYGATIRFYDKNIDAWRSTWIGPVKGYVIPFIARQIGDEIVLEGKLAEGTEVKWIFSEITKESFRWRFVQSADGWTSEVKVQEMFCRRTE
jgi:hypothetical protein